MTDNLTYEKVKEIVTNNPDITAEGFYEQLKQKGTDREIFDSLAGAISSERQDVSENYAVFLKIVKLFTQLDIRVKRSSGGRTILDIAATNKQSEIIKIFLESGEFNEEEKLQALNSAIVQGNVQEFEVFLDYIDHAKILEALNKASCNENTDIMKVLLDNKRFTGQEKVEVLSDAVIGGNAPIVKLLLNHMKGIPEAGMKGLLEIKKESKLSLEKELRIDSEFKGDPNNSNHREYFSTIAIIKLLESSISKKEEKQSDNQTDLTNPQFSPPSEEETKYKESKENFHISLRNDVVGVVITGLFIAAAVMVPSVAGAVVCSIVAALALVATVIHVENSTLPSYKEMREVELTKQSYCIPANTKI